MITLNLARGDNYESVPLRLPTTPGEVDEVFAALDAASRYAGEVQIIGVDSGVPSLAKPPWNLQTALPLPFTWIRLTATS